MKILHIIDSLGLGGAQTVIKGIFESQQENNNIFLFSLRKREINIEIKHKNIIFYDSNSKYSFFQLFQLKKLIKKEKIDVLHCHLFKSQVFGWLLKKLFFPKIKLIFHEHGGIFQSNFYYNFFIKISKKDINKIIVVSYATKKELIKIANVPEKKIEKLYNFVDLKRFNKKKIRCNTNKERKKLGINNNEFVLGFAGRLSEEKGCEYLIKALPNLDFKYKCLIAGEGELKKRLEKLVKKLKIKDKIIFLGYQKDIIKFYSIIDVLIVPSLIESFGISVIEAQARGVPVISSNLPSLSEIIKNSNNGMLFKERNCLDLSIKINLIYKNKKLRKKIINKALISVKKYDLANYVVKLNKVYKDLK